MKRCLVLLGFFVVLSSLQAADALKPRVFAIRDARVVTEPGKVLPRATVIIRDGLIEAVGPDAGVPPDAFSIDGKGLTVYAGFLDALSSWGFDTTLRRSEIGTPAPEDPASEALAVTKADNRKGMTPEFQVHSALKPDAEQADAWRKLGFTAHLVTPDGGIIVGQSALVSLSGAATREAVLRTPVGMHLVFRTVAGGDYPRSLMGVVAHCRQTLLDAGHYQRLWRVYEASGQAGRRPPLDPALAELGPVLEGKLPLFFEADSRDEIHRALAFAQEFQLHPILCGGRNAGKAVDAIKTAGAPVILRLHFTDASPPPPAENVVPERVRLDRERRQKEEQRGAALLHERGIRFAFGTQGDRSWEKFRDNLGKLLAAGLPPEAALRALTVDAAHILGVSKQLGTVTPGKLAHLVVTDGDFHEAATQVRHVFVDGARFDYEAKPKGKKPDAKPEAKPKDKPEAKTSEKATEIEADRQPRLRTGGHVLLRGGTVITVSGNVLPETDVLVQKGKIAVLGKALKTPPGAKEIDVHGLYVMPGIIDTHCHFAVDGSVNEFSLSVVPEVRIGDVIDSEDVQIFRALAGGVTTARLLHGSSNAIGGQDAVIKLKYGASASALPVPGAPRGVKFALGENVKRRDGRFPNTRLGVEAVLVRAFTEAQAYRKTWEQYDKARATGKPAVEPRRDLRLEALVDILKGDLKIHCHCYRTDEILMLLGVAERFGVKIQSLQHALEGYKIAPEIAAHGASCSIFSDWWAYKLEAYNAIPFNAVLMHEAGVSVCMKSDSNELMRHLFQEAAKCIKYGGMSEAEAFKTITLNPARQLGLAQRLGSIEVGKDADFAIFNGHPLNSYSRVEMTLVEGEVYFQRAEKMAPEPAAKAAPACPALPLGALPKGGRYYLTNVMLHPVSSPAHPVSGVLIDHGKIARIIPKDQVVTTGETVLDARGLHLYPGMIDAGTVLGLTEVDSARETQDFAEGGDFQPDLRASIAIHPDSELIPVTRANGVTTVVTRPMGAMVAGQGALINLAGWVPREMTIVDPLTLHIDFPSAGPMRATDPGVPLLGRAVARKQREEKIRRLKELFRLALAHDDARKQDPDRPANPRLEALIPYLRGNKPVVIQTNRQPEIVEALKLAEEFKLKLILSGGCDAWKVADQLKKQATPVIVGPIMAMPQESHDPYDAPYACPAKLHKAGVTFCIRSQGTSNTRNLPYEAAMAAAHGLSPEEALRAVTLYPAQILGVADQLGSIDEGKRANLVLTNGDLLQASTQVLAVIIDGRAMEPTSKHTRLYERYRERLREVKEGKTPPGTK